MIEADSGCGCALGRIEQMIRYAFWSSGSSGIVIGVSGGIDSAVAAALCVRAVGGEHVLGLTLPTRVTNPSDIADAVTLCSGLGITHKVMPIDAILDAYQGLPGFTTDRYLLGNLMARTRMAILYYHANRDHRIVCGTSNRTEYLLGYCTKYGDNAADFQPILHLYKSEVYQAAEALGIPDGIIGKIPSAGLWPGQKDEDEIGLSYAEIDAALIALAEQNWEPRGASQERVLALVRRSSHKRFSQPSLL